MKSLSHIDNKGAAHMVDVSVKAATGRTARAEALIHIGQETLALILAGNAPKGDVIAVARVAGIMAAKKTADLIPLCHSLPLSQVTIDFTSQPEGRLLIEASAKTDAKTGVEMEALTAVAVAALTLYDMVKAKAREAVIEHICLIEKTGGKSGDYKRTRP